MIPLYDDEPGKRFPVVTLAIIAANIAVYFIWQCRIGMEASVASAALVPHDLVAHPSATTAKTLLSSLFLHGGILHLGFNMWFLWIFGNNIEDLTGPLRFLLFYLLCGVAASLAYVQFSPHSHIPLIGASGAVSGVLGAYFVRFPKAGVITAIPIFIILKLVRIPAAIFLLIWIAFQVISQLLEAHSGGHPGGVAYIAHIAGFIAGIPLIFLLARR